MGTINLDLDRTAQDTVTKLKHFYGMATNAELITKALWLLKVAAEVEMTNGKLIAKKGTNEGQIIVRS